VESMKRMRKIVELDSRTGTQTPGFGGGEGTHGIPRPKHFGRRPMGGGLGLRGSVFLSTSYSEEIKTDADLRYERWDLGCWM